MNMEPKRISTVPVAPVAPEKKSKNQKKTFRFNLALGESTEKQCPEYSLKDLINKSKVSIN